MLIRNPFNFKDYFDCVGIAYLNFTRFILQRFATECKCFDLSLRRNFLHYGFLLYYVLNALLLLRIERLLVILLRSNWNHLYMRYPSLITIMPFKFFFMARLLIARLHSYQLLIYICLTSLYS